MTSANVWVRLIIIAVTTFSVQRADIEVTGLIVSIASVSFGIIFAYIVGLWLFFCRVALLLGAIAFSMPPCRMAFMIGMTLGLHGMLIGTDRTRAKAKIKSSGLSNFGCWRPDFLMGLSLYDVCALLGFISFFTIYVALAYMMLFYTWPKMQNPE